jgi:hypothetical protein
MSCDVQRRLVGVQPARNRHETWHYECPKCQSAFRLVVPRPEFNEVLFNGAALPVAV